jgi:hypothetical protein
MTDPAEYGSLFTALSDDIPTLCKITQNLIIHSEDLERYGVNFPEEWREYESNLRKVSRQIKHVLELNNTPISNPRQPENRVVGNCRDFSTFLTAILWHKRIPARVRCGFCTYLHAHKYVNHFVCQYWSFALERWIWIDAMIDDVLRDGYNINIDTHDIPEGWFLPAGDCWLMCRTGKANPELFWYFLDWRGMPFILGNLVRDLLSLNKIEPLPWDKCAIMPDNNQKEIPLEDIELIDRIAAVTKGINPVLSEVRSIYENEGRLHLPDFVEQHRRSI